MHQIRRALASGCVLVLLAAGQCAAATWQHFVPFETGRRSKAGQAVGGKVMLWLPPRSETVRGLLVGGQLARIFHTRRG